MGKMNEIETMYWNAFVDYLKTKPIECIFVNDLNNSRNAVFKFENFDLIEGQSGSKSMILSNYIPTVYEDENLQLLRQDNIFSLTASNIEDVKIGGYSPDFDLWCSKLRFVIEIDGHNFHEKTKEQVKADKQKDRNYLKLGYTPIRFSASEIYTNPIECVKETLQIVLYSLIHTMIRESDSYENAYYIGYERGVKNGR